MFCIANFVDTFLSHGDWLPDELSNDKWQDLKF